MLITPARSALFELVRQRRRVLRIRRQHVDRVGIGQRIVDQVAQGPHRFGVGIFGVQRVELNRSHGETDTAATASTPNPIRTTQRRRRSPGRCAPRTRSRPRPPRHPDGTAVIAAGRKPSVQMNAMIIPAPAISPSSATPENAVGTKARKPAAVARAAIRICTPTRCAVAVIAAADSPVSKRNSR